MILFRFFPEVV